ncbi:MAG: hypothetical protein WDA59_08010 [Methanofastidiosum sp.]|nr:hypothetical protein [Alkaliphilus sp.]
MISLNAEGHLFISGLLNILFLVFVYYVLGMNPFQGSSFFLLIITFFIFSLLPDIDHPLSKISGIFYLCVIGLFLISLLSLFNRFNFFDLLKMIAAVGLFLIHQGYALNSPDHRRFPHTFKFGIVSCLILFLLVNSWIVTTVGAISFASHIWADKYMYETFLKVKKRKDYQVEVTSWIANEKRIPTQFQAIIVRETEKAFLFRANYPFQSDVWIPKSQINYIYELNN